MKNLCLFIFLVVPVILFSGCSGEKDAAEMENCSGITREALNGEQVVRLSEEDSDTCDY